MKSSNDSSDDLSDATFDKDICLIADLFMKVATDEQKEQAIKMAKNIMEASSYGS